jgi:uncharacterized iron-regulated membrane protein
VVQGPLVRGAVTALGIGNEAARFGYAPPTSETMGAALGRVPWSQDTQPMPASDPAHAGHGDGAGQHATSDLAAIMGTDAIAAKAAAFGLTSDYRLYLPAGPNGIYTVLTSPGQPEGQRTLQFDRWSGQIIGENGWNRYGVGAKAIELGVQIHMGRYFGLANQLLMLLPCIAIVVLVTSGVTMWWRRRPRGSMGAPSAVSGARLRGVLTILIIAGIALPLFGASLVILGVLDRMIGALRQPASA